MGDRQIFRCKNCGRKFTPKNQPAGDAAERPAPASEAASVAAVRAATENPVAPPATPVQADRNPESPNEVVEHPRY
jgi:hypothetical protein